MGGFRNPVLIFRLPAISEHLTYLVTLKSKKTISLDVNNAAEYSMKFYRFPGNICVDAL